MGKAYYDIVPRDAQWGILHDGAAEGDYETKEAAFEAACAAASNAIKFGHEVRVTVPGREAVPPGDPSKATALGSRSD